MKMILISMAQEQKKLRTLLSEKEAMPHLKRPGSSFGRAAEPCNVNRKRVDAGRFASSAAPSVRSGASSSSSSSGGASATELIRPRSSAAGAGQCGEFFKGARRLSAPPFNYVGVSKGGSMSSSLALS
jgi:protein regulator of cytokinesis 1